MPIEPSSVLLTDRVAVVTGVGRGVGQATALLFARFGAKLAVCERVPETLADTEKQLAEIGGPVLSRQLDVRNRESVEQFLASVEETYGRVDILVNNAGGTFFAHFMDVSVKGEQTMIDENFTQVTSFIRGCVPMMPDGGAIVNLTSIEAHQAAPGFGVYAAMKAALASLTRTLALELGPRRIRVNAVAPDAVTTGGDEHAREEMLAAGAIYEPIYSPPLGYFAHPEECASVVLFLASDLSKFVTGVTIQVDGGNGAAGGWRSIRQSMP
jgi:NAD(P)-dependent dehydrogenase (short-subunit alcohol dehydrogenase family)